MCHSVQDQDGYLLATPSGTVRQINGKWIWQVITLHFWKSVDTLWVLDTSPIPYPFLPHFVGSINKAFCIHLLWPLGSLANIVCGGCGNCCDNSRNRELCLLFKLFIFFLFFLKLLSPVQKLWITMLSPTALLLSKAESYLIAIPTTQYNVK